MNYNELTALLKRAGWRLHRNGKGSHKIWAHPASGLLLTVPDHGGRELKPALVAGIRKQAGV